MRRSKRQTDRDTARGTADSLREAFPVDVGNEGKFSGLLGKLASVPGAGRRNTGARLHDVYPPDASADARFEALRDRLRGGPSGAQGAA
jgi:hypothetical protein